MARKELTWKEAIIKVFNDNSNVTMHYKTIAQAIIDNGYRHTYGKTPQDTVNAQLTTNPNLFRKEGNGNFSLIITKNGEHVRSQKIEEEVSQKGYVYILTNPSFREDWIKIGKSARPVDVRSKELDNTAIPLPFEIYATLKTAKYEKVEKLVHKTIDRLTDLRIRKNREFFNVTPIKALEILKDIAETIDDAEIDEVYLRNNS